MKKSGNGGSKTHGLIYHSLQSVSSIEYEYWKNEFLEHVQNVEILSYDLMVKHIVVPDVDMNTSRGENIEILSEMWIKKY